MSVSASAHLSVPLQMLPDGHSLLDEVVQVLGEIWGQALGLEDPQNLVAGDKTHLGHTMGVPQNDTWTEKRDTLQMGTGHAGGLQTKDINQVQILFLFDTAKTKEWSKVSVTQTYKENI